MDHLLEDRGEVVADLDAQGPGQVGPDIGGSGGHRPSQCPARVTNSVIASNVSVVWGAGRGGARLVAATGSRKIIVCR
jgi:hypothetical protein